MQWIAILTMVIGSSLWASGSLYLKYSPSKSSVYVTTSIQLMSAGIACSLIFLASDEVQTFSMGQVKSEAITALAYLALVSSLITFLAFIWLIKVQPPAIVSTYSYVNPLVATLLGWAVADEIISSIQLIALATILAGVLLVNIPRYQTLKG